MSIVAGTRLGPYEIISPLGAGGMGEVYRARDTRLDRSVAVKILPAEFAQDAQLRARFEREAKTISQLNHPNICTLHDVGDNFLVMELLEGETLATRIDRGPLPLEQVIRYGIDIARGLDVAHRLGIVHRDLKPGNVMITKSVAKVLDFGLAKGGGEVGLDYDAATIQRSLTSEGMIIGTFQYMSPEQLEGQHVDHRTDIFALGAVLYEMATGRRAFDGKTKTSLIAAIVASQPKPVHELQPLTPAAFEHVISKCLAKDPEDRWQSAQDIASELEWILEGLGREVKPSRARALPWMFATAALALALAGAIAAMVIARRNSGEPRMSVALAMPPRLVDYYDQAALSPDGNTVVLIGYKNNARQLWVRKIEEPEPHLLAATNGAVQPFWSADGKSIAFFADGKLKRIPAAGGPPQTICDAPAPTGGTWNANNVIVFSAGGVGPLTRVDANGGKPQALTKLLPNEEAHRWPQFLPDGEHLVILVDADVTEGHHIKVVSLRDGSMREVMQGVTNAIYAEPGYLLFVRGGSLMAQPFDAGKMMLNGDPHVVAEQVADNGINHHHEFTAANGRLIYRSLSPDSQLTWLDRNGKSLEVFGDAHRYGTFQLSRDQKRIVIEQLDADGRGDDLWLVDRGRNVTTRFTFDPASDVTPVWAPDSTRVAFLSMRDRGDVFMADASNPTNVMRLTNLHSSDMTPTSWSPDGESLLMDRQVPGKSDFDIWVYSFRTHELKPFIATQFSETSATVSPDGTRIAYRSEEAGRGDIYVASYPSLSGRRQVSSGGGWNPHWRPDGRELYWVGAAGAQLVAFDVTKDEAVPQPLFRYLGYDYSVAPDGQRFLTEEPIEDPTHVPLTLVTGWSGR
jgi:Tol biopolymer transport system component/predicted Ser/Thr protein kinase